MAAAAIWMDTALIRPAPSITLASRGWRTPSMSAIHPYNGTLQQSKPSICSFLSNWHEHLFS
jgi:hypothetical protein